MDRTISRMCQLAALIVVVVLVAPGFSQAGKPAGGGGTTGTVQGYVKDASTLQPIQNAFVEILGTSKTQYTDQDGFYSITKVNAGTYIERVSASLYFTQTRNVTVTGGGTTTQNFNLVLAPPPGSVTGFTLDKGTFQPLVGVHITLTGTAYAADSQFPDGLFTISGVSPGNYTLKAEKAGYVTYVHPLTLSVVTGVTTNVGNISLVELSRRMPKALTFASAAYDSIHTYQVLIAGGTSTGSDYLNQIVEYDPMTDLNVTVSNVFSTGGRQSASATFDGTNMWVFGGKTSGGASRDVFGYNPVTNVATPYTMCLPKAMWGTSAVCVGGYSYIIGGAWGTTASKMSNSIYLFNPTTHKTTTISATLPSNRAYTSAAFTSNEIYVFGGISGNTYLDQIVRVSMSDYSVDVLSAKLPTPSAYSAAIRDPENGFIYIFGGKSASGLLDTVVVFDPVSLKAVAKTVTLPYALCGACAVNDLLTDFVIGGETANGNSNLVTRYQDYYYSHNTKGTDSYYAYAAGAINTANGNLVIRDEDLSFQAKGFKVSLERTYNSYLFNSSDTDAGGPFGKGWTHNYNIKVSNYSKWARSYGDVILTEACGSTHLFLRNPDGTYTTPPGSSQRMTGSIADGTLRLWSLDGTFMSFDTMGRLQSITNKEGNMLHLEYDAVGQLAPFGLLLNVHDDSGLYMNFTYQGSLDRIATVSSPGGSLSYAYSYNGLVNVWNIQKCTETFYYYYQNSVWPYTVGPMEAVRKEAEDRRITHPEDPNYTVGVTIYDTTRFVYEAYGNEDTRRVTEIWRSETYTWGGVPTPTYPPVRKYLIEYLNSTATRVTCALGGTLDVTMNSDGLPTRMSGSPLVSSGGGCGGQGSCGGGVSFPGNDGNENLTLSWTRGFQIAASTDGNGHSISYHYDSFGNLIRATDAMGASVNTTYEVIDSNRYIALALDSTDALGKKTTYEYDQLGHLIKNTDPLGFYSQMWYDNRGNLIQMRDKAGRLATYDYNNLGLLSNITNSLGETYSYESDLLGELFNKTTPMGFVTSKAIEYDFEFGSLETTTDASGNSSQTYRNYAGSLLKQVNAAGLTTTFKVNVTLGVYDIVKDALGHVTTNKYDSMGRLLSIIDSNGHQTNFTYDRFARLRTVTLPMGQVYEFAYDKAGNMVAQRHPRGYLIQFTYDAANRLTNTTYPDGSYVKRTYDAVGHMTSVTGLGFSKNMVYDAMGRQTEITTHYQYLDIYGASISRDLIERITYDPRGSISSDSLQDSLSGSTAVYVYSYDAVGRVAEMKVGPDPASGLWWVGWNFTYDHDGRRTQMRAFSNVAYPGGTYHPTYTTSLSYDSRGNVRTISTSSTGVFTPPSYSYEYDELNRIVRASEPGSVMEYAYDDVGNLESYHDNGVITTLTYDAVGNRLSKTDSSGTINYSYDGNGRLTSSSDGVAYAYDEAGNLVYTSRAPTSEAAEQYYTYDYENHLITVGNSSDQPMWKYSYSGDGQKMLVFYNVTGSGWGEFEMFAYAFASGLPKVAYYEAMDQISAFMLYFPGTDEFLGYQRPDTTNEICWFALRDGLGNTRWITVARGSESDSADGQSYSPFGEMATPPSDMWDQYGILPSFQGRDYDLITGLYDYRARSYDPTIGRYTARSGEPKYDESAYMFPSNDLVNGRDPTGNPGGRTKFFSFEFTNPNFHPNIGSHEYGMGTAIWITTEKLMEWRYSLLGYSTCEKWDWGCMLKWAEYFHTIVSCADCIGCVIILVASVIAGTGLLAATPAGLFALGIYWEMLTLTATSCAECIASIYALVGTSWIENQGWCEPRVDYPCENPWW